MKNIIGAKTQRLKARRTELQYDILNHLATDEHRAELLREYLKIDTELKHRKRHPRWQMYAKAANTSAF